MNDRSQIVKFNSKLSRKAPVSYGVVQGSVLGPTLFNVFVNDLSVGLARRGLLNVLYADDLILTILAKTTAAAREAATSALSFLLDWSRVWRLPINVNKSNCMLFCLITAPLPEPIVISNKVFTFVHEACYLGVIIKSNLKWDAHIRSVVRKSYAIIFSFFRVMRFLPSDTAIKAYLGLVRPLIEYACPVFYSALPNYLTSALEKIQKHFLRLLFGDFTLAYDCLLCH